MTRRLLLAALILLAEACGLVHAADKPTASPSPLFQPPQRPAVPQVKNKSWCVNPLDAFIVAALESKGLSPSPRAEKLRLLRRVTFDLTGLPPTIAEQEAFLVDDLAGRLPEGRRPSAGLAALRRTLGHALARPRPLRRDRRLQGRRPATRGAIATAITSSVRSTPTCPTTVLSEQQLAGDELEPDNPDALDRHRLQSAVARRVQRRQPRTAPPGNPRRHDRHDRAGFPRPDGRLCPLPRSQVRPDPAKGLLTACKRSSPRCRPRDDVPALEAGCTGRMQEKPAGVGEGNKGHPRRDGRTARREARRHAQT